MKREQPRSLGPTRNGPLALDPRGKIGRFSASSPQPLGTPGAWDACVQCRHPAIKQLDITRASAATAARSGRILRAVLFAKGWQKGVFVCARANVYVVSVVSVLQWRKVLLPFTVSLSCRNGCFDFDCRLWPDCTTSLLRYKLENRLSLGGALCRRFVGYKPENRISSHGTLRR